MEKLDKNIEFLSKLSIDLDDQFDQRMIEMSRKPKHKNEIEVPVFISLVAALVIISIYTFTVSVFDVDNSKFESNRADYIKSIEKQYSDNSYYI